MVSPDFALSSYEFDVLWTHLRLPRMPYPLGVPRTGRTTAEQAMLAEEVRKALADRGLLTDDHEVDEGLAALLRLLAAHRVAVDLVADIGYPVRALAASDGEAGVLAMLAGGELWLTGIGPDRLAEAIAGLLRGAPAPRGSHPAAVREQVAAPPRAAVAPVTVLPELATDCRATGRFGVSAGDGGPVPATVTWFDTEAGPYLVAHEGARLTIGPTDHAGIERRVAALVSTVDDRGWWPGR